MAEARAACHPVPGIGLHKFTVDPNLHTTQAAMSPDGFVLYIPHPRYVWRNLKRAVHEARTQIQTLLWPLRPRLVIAFVLGFCGFVSSKPSDHWMRGGRIADAIWRFDCRLPYTELLPVPVRVAYLATSTAWAIIGVVVFCQKAALRMILSYHGWMFEARGKRSLATTIWGTCLKYGYLQRGLVAGKPGLLFAFQFALPSLKPPQPESTVAKYLQSMKPLTSDEEHAKLAADAQDFLKSGMAKRLQSYLWLKSLVYRNYVTDWWVNFVYLRGRSSLFINSNFYGLGDGNPDVKPSDDQLARASVITFLWLNARQIIDRERLPPLCINDLVPLCMDQYRACFNSVRRPGLQTDTLHTWDMDESKHIVVTYKGRYYAVTPFDQKKGRLLPPGDILSLFEGVVAMDNGTTADSPDARIAALTTMERTKWATVRENEIMDNPHNKHVLDMIERAMFIVNLDDGSPETITKIGHDCFVSDGTQRWCDKSFSIIIFKNGKMGLHTEHTWADAPVIAHLVEWTLAMEQRHMNTFYTADGKVQTECVLKGPAKWRDIPVEIHSGPTKRKPARFVAPQTLTWKLTPSLIQHIDDATAGARAAIADLDLEVREFAVYGKGLIKKAGVSPDAWIQAALQLAYYNDQGRFDLTYESSMTRLYHAGRTETIRSCTQESCAFVRAMHDGGKTTSEERLALLRKASDKHVDNSRQCMVGEGIDRHLFAMYVVAVGKEIDVPFLKNALSLPWKLSTSQVPQRQLPKGAWPNEDMGDKYYTPSGGFGPVADDGYGVSYVVCGDLRFFFHVSSKKQCKSTDSTRMQKAIREAFLTMGRLVKPDLEDKGTCRA